MISSKAGFEMSDTATKLSLNYFSASSLAVLIFLCKPIFLLSFPNRIFKKKLEFDLSSKKKGTEMSSTSLSLIELRYLVLMCLVMMFLFLDRQSINAKSGLGVSMYSSEKACEAPLLLS